jgi:hypothetical protein
MENYLKNQKANFMLLSYFNKIFNSDTKQISYSKLIFLAKFLKNKKLLNYLSELNYNNPNISKNNFNKLQLHIKLNILDLLNLNINDIKFETYDERVFLLFILYKNKEYVIHKKYISNVKCLDILQLFPDLKLNNFTIIDIMSKINKLHIDKINFLINLLEN